MDVQETKNLAWNTLVSMEGWCSKEKSDALIDSVYETKPRTVVEIGVFGGRSLVALAMACRALGRGRAWGIDPMCKDDSLKSVKEPEHADWWSKIDYEKIYEGSQRAVVNHGLSAFANILRVTSERAQYLFDEVDLLHIDGNHSESASTQDVCMWVPKVPSGGFIWFDDTDWPSTANAQRLIAERCDKIRSVGTCDLYRKR